MFFNQDILFKSGPCAFLWMIGNDDAKAKEIMKRRRSKQHTLLLDSNISDLCTIVRDKFPEMGTAYGLSLKKAMTLVKGLGVIYLYKVDHLTRTVQEVHLRMQMVASIRQIDLPKEMAPKGDRGEDFAANMDIGFGGFQELDNLADVGGSCPRAFAVNITSAASSQDRSPRQREILTPPPGGETRRHRKRRRQDSGERVDDDQILRLLQDAVEQNPRAHCLTETNIHLGPPSSSAFPEFGNFEDDFGGTVRENVLSTMGDGLGGAPPGEFEIPDIVVTEPPALHSPPNRASTRELDEGRGRRGQLLRRRTDSNESEVSGEIDELQLGALEDVSQRPRGRRRKRARAIDDEMQLPMEVIHAQIRGQPRPLDYDNLRDEFMRDNTRKSRKLLKYGGTSEGLSLVMSIDSGRKPIGSQLQEFVQGRYNEAIRSRQPSLRGRQRDQERTDDDVYPERSVGREEIPQSIVQHPTFELQGPQGRSLEEDLAPPPVSEMMNEFDVQLPSLSPPSERGLTGDGIQDVEISRHGKYFKQLFPPAQVNAKKAAFGFYKLLRLYAERKVNLEQSDPFGDILVTQIL